MAAVSDFEHLNRASHLLSQRVQEVLDAASERLETGASTSDINALRTASMAVTLIAVGLVGTFEGMLQQKFGWNPAYAMLAKVLKAKGREDLADRFKAYQLAVNVLKHGEGSSYDRLIERRASLPFAIKGRDEAFFDEGDVAEVGGLVDTRGSFIDDCLDVINEIKGVLGI